MNEQLTLGLAQISPIWLNKDKTIEKIIKYIDKAGNKDCDLVCFGESLLPGYPFWVEWTNGAKFQSEFQKMMFAHYHKNAISVEHGDLDEICEACAQNKVAAIVGTIEKAHDRGGHSLYCSLIYISKGGKIENVHRKLIPTYEERLVWSPGDGHGLRVFPVGAFTMGALNCWENWMPLVRSSLYAQGENLHISIWPGGYHNTHDLMSFIAKESRSYVVGVSGLMKKTDIPLDIPGYDEIIAAVPESMANGGSCVCGPNGKFILEPQLHEENLFVVHIDFDEVRKERQNFDPAGHYSRPDITQLHINRERQSTLKITD